MLGVSAIEVAIVMQVVADKTFYKGIHRLLDGEFLVAQRQIVGGEDARAQQRVVNQFGFLAFGILDA